MPRKVNYKKGDKVYICVKGLSEYGLQKGLEGEVRSLREDGKYLVDFGTTMQPVETAQIKKLIQKKKEKKEDLEIIEQPPIKIDMLVDEDTLDAIGITEDYVKSLEDKKVSIKNDVVNHPQHYTNGTIEVWDFIISQNMSFPQGSAIKYISRYKNKNGKEDLLKAIAFINKIIETEYE